MFGKKREFGRIKLNGSICVVDKDVADYILYLEDRLESSESMRLQIREERNELINRLREHEERYLKNMRESISELQRAKIWTDTVVIPTSRAIAESMQKQADEVCPTTTLDNGIIMTKSSRGVTFYIPFDRVSKDDMERIKRAIEEQMHF